MDESDNSGSDAVFGQSASKLAWLRKYRLARSDAINKAKSNSRSNAESTYETFQPAADASSLPILTSMVGESRLNIDKLPESYTDFSLNLDESGCRCGTCMAGIAYGR